MKQPLPAAAAAALLTLALAWAIGAQTLGTTPSPMATVEATLAILDAIPAPADDPMLDANGNVVYDPIGNPVSDPKESFHSVKPSEFDPSGTHLVQAAWLHGIGCPTDATTTAPTSSFTDPACPTGDPRDQRNQGLLLVKTGPTENNAAAVAELKKVKGITVTELGYDIRKSGGSGASPLGSHCGAGAPRFDVITTDGLVHFIGCNSPPALIAGASDGWVRLRWDPATAFPPVTSTVQRILIVFDEGQDPSGGPDSFGAAILDNIDVNGVLVGRGATDAD